MSDNSCIQCNSIVHMIGIFSRTDMIKKVPICLFEVPICLGTEMSHTGPICPGAEVSRIPHTHIRSGFNWYFYSNKWPPHQHGQQSHKVYPIVSIDQYLRVHVQMLYESKCVVLVQGGKSGPNWKSCSHCWKKLWSIQQYSNLWKKIEVEIRNVIERWHSTMCMYQLKFLDTRCY